MDKSILYVCDPDKCIECSKSNCFINDGPCHSTIDPKQAKLDDNGNPIISKDIDTE